MYEGESDRVHSAILSSQCMMLTTHKCSTASALFCVTYLPSIIANTVAWANKKKKKKKNAPLESTPTRTQLN